MVVRHIARCKEIAFLKEAIPVIIPESNMPLVALALQRSLKHDYKLKCQFMTEDKNRNAKQKELPGMITTYHNKLKMVALMQKALAKENGIVMYPDFVVASSEGVESTTGINIRKEFESQFREFQRIKQYCTDATGAAYAKFFYNGKRGGGNDDFVMSTMIGLFMHQLFEESEKYQNVRAM
jgi:hypothetical protein